MCCVLHACVTCMHPRRKRKRFPSSPWRLGRWWAPPQSPAPIRMKRSSIPGHIPSAPARPQKNHAAREQPPLQKRIRPNSAEVGRDANPAVPSNPIPGPLRWPSTGLPPSPHLPRRPEPTTSPSCPRPTTRANSAFPQPPTRFDPHPASPIPEEASRPPAPAAIYPSPARGSQLRQHRARNTRDTRRSELTTADPRLSSRSDLFFFLLHSGTEKGVRQPKPPTAFTDRRCRHR